MTQRRGKQSAEAAAQTRFDILEAARAHFSEKGFTGAGLRDIAADAGTTHGLIRHHFGSKLDLWRAMMDDYVRQFEERQRPLVAALDREDPVELLKGLATNFIRVSAELPLLAKILMTDCSRPGPHLDYVVERIRPLHAAIEPVGLAAQERGVLKGHDPDSFFIFLLMLGSLPFALSDFTNVFYRTKIGSKAGIERHIELVLQTMFGQ